MGAQGTTTIDFGAFPGKSDASVAVADAAILSGSLVEAWLYPVTTADHLADEHLVETLDILAGNVVAGVGFTIYGANEGSINEPVTPEPPAGPGQPDAQARDRGGKATRLYGLWTVAWCWN